MMKFAFYNSSMNTEVAPQPQPRGTESWTVGALEVSSYHCRGCSAVSLSGSIDFQASSLFEVGSSSVNRASSWQIPPSLSDWCGTTGDWLWLCLYTAVLVYLGFFCWPWVPSTSGISASNTPLFESCWLVYWFLWHINLCRLFNAKSIFM